MEDTEVKEGEEVEELRVEEWELVEGREGEVHIRSIVNTNNYTGLPGPMIVF